LVLGVYLLALEENLALTNVGELLREELSLGDTVSKDEVNHAHV